MSAAPQPRRAPIDRVTIPLAPRTTAGCCDLAVLYYGRYVVPLIRLYFSMAIPAICLVYGIQRFVGGGLALIVAVLLIFSKPLGLLIVAAAWRTTFDEPFDWHASRQERPRSRRDRLRGTAESILTAGAALGIFALIAATIDDEYGSGRLVQLGTGAAVGFVLVVVAIIIIWAGYAHCRDYRPSPRLRRALISQMSLRLLLAAPCGLVFFEDYQTLAVILLIFWIPLTVIVILARAFKTEALALADIDPELLSSEAQKRQQNIDQVGPGLIVVAAGVTMLVVFVFGLDVIIRTLGLSGPITDPLVELFSAQFWGWGTTISVIASNPAFGALVVAVGLFVYQLARLAWFFVFLDSRVRFDCWDMELLLAREAKRLENA